MAVWPASSPHAVLAREQAIEWRAWLTSEAATFSGVALIARDDRIEAEMAFGLADQASRRTNARDTRFNLGSINKTFTAIGIAQLIDQGRLVLDDTLIKFLPDYLNKDAAGRISIRQLLTHRSGVAQFMRADFGDVSVEAMTKIVAAEPLAFDPGTRQVYSNGGYVVLGRIIEVVSGRSYAEYVADRIYRPASMTASGFVGSTDRTDQLALPGAPDSLPRAGNPAGGGYSTAADLWRFARALRAGRLLSAKMTRYVLDETFAEDPKWGFSLREQMAGTRRFIGNGGGAPGINAEFRFEPAGGYTVVVISNASPPSATNLLTAIINRIAGVPAAPSPAPPLQAGAIGLRTEVEGLHTVMMAAFREDPSSVSRFYTDDARILGGGRRYTGAEQVRTYFSQVPAGATWTLEIIDVGGGASEPWVLGRSTLGRAGAPGMTVDYLAILKRGADGRLRYHIDMFTAGVR
jgi:CubicO group peptidase (beta-lactamase class C family)